MSGHTPGPWCVRDLPTAQRYIGPANDGAASSVARVLARVNLPDEQIDADAQLVASAPELLAALKEALADLEYLAKARDADYARPDPEIIDAARAAIAKAEGQA